MKNNMPMVEVSRLQRNSCFTSDLVFFLNRDYQYIFVNEVYLKYHQKKHEEIIGHALAEHIGTDLFERQVKQHIDCCFENQIVHHQQWFDFAGPGLRYIEISYYPYCEEQGKVIGIVANGRDITNGLVSETALQIAKNQLKLMAKAGNIGLWDWDFRTNKVYFSPEWKQQIGYLDHEISGDYLEWESRVHPMDLDRAKKHIKTFITNPWPNYTNEFRFKHRDGSYRWIMATASLLNDENDQPVRMLGAHIDVTDRKEREEELRQKEEALRTAQTVAGIGSWWFTPADHLSKWTEEMFHIFGLPLDSQIPVYDEYKHFFNPNDWALLDASVNQALAKGTGYNLELRLKTTNGQKNRYVNIIGEPVRNEQGVITLLIGTLQDISHRKIAEQELLASKEKYLNLFESIRDAILVVDVDRTIIDCNQAFVDIFGYDKGDVVGLKTLFLYGNESEFIEMGKVIKDHFGEEHFSFTVHYKKKSGQVFPCDTSIFYLKDSCGKVSGFIGLIRDVSERLEIENQVRKSESRFRSMVENLFDAVVVINNDGIIRFVNHLACQLFDQSEEDLIGSSFGFPLSSPIGHQIDIIQKDGTIKIAEIKIASDAWDDELVYLASIRDITDKVKASTERIELEKKLQQIQKVEAIGTLAGGIAHDFNNILTPIIGFTQLAQEKVIADELVSECLAEVFQAACRARELVNQILVFSRQSTDVVYQPILVEPLIKEVLKLIRAVLPTTISIEQDFQSQGQILGEQTEIHQIMMNLCTNAKHAMEQSGGILKVSLHDVRLTEAIAKNIHPELHSGLYVHLRVNDTGCGMDSVVLGKIFEPYFTTKPLGKGTGLGLSVVHGIILNHKGVITVDSQVNQGTTFDIYIPQIKSQEKNIIEGESELPTGTEHILLVDDEPAILRLNSKNLERLGYEVTTRASSLEAMALFAANPEEFDLILTDMTMPGMRGDQLAVQCIAIRPDIPIVLITGYSEIITEVEAYQIGIKAILMKPVTKAEIAKTIRSTLQPPLTYPDHRQRILKTPIINKKGLGNSLTQFQK